VRSQHAVRRRVIVSMTALLVFAGHLRGACKNARLLEHFSRQCDAVFGACEKVLVTYTSPFGVSVNGKRRAPTHQLSHAQCLRRISEHVHFDNIQTVEETTSRNRANRYHQMIANVLLGIRMAQQSRHTVALRMRPDAGIGGINALLSNATWRTLLDIPADTIVQYGTYQGRDGDRVNGDNAFAARSGTFGRFVRLWSQEAVELLSSGAYEHAELTMSTVARRHNFTLSVPPPLRHVPS
jgi:hypothetical protein